MSDSGFQLEIFLVKVVVGCIQDEFSMVIIMHLHSPSLVSFDEKKKKTATQRKQNC